MPVRLFIHPFSIAAFLYLFFIVTLHPITGLLGGLLFLLTAWAIPSSINIAVSLGIASFLSKSWIVRGLIAIPISAAIALLPSIYSLNEAANYEPQTEYEIRQVLNYDEDDPLETAFGKRVPIFPYPIDPRIEVGGNEGCGCMYFKKKESSEYRWPLGWKFVKFNINTGGGRNYEYLHANHWNDPEMAWLRTDHYFRLSTETSPDSEDAIMFTLEIMKGKEVLSVFKHKNIPKHYTGNPLQESEGKGYEETIWDNYLQRSAHIILHGSFWRYFLSSKLPSFFPDKELDAFFALAVKMPSAQ